MNAARENAARLVKDAKLLLENERYASALALAILAIEETQRSTSSGRFFPMYQPNAKHPEMLDVLKQLSFYTDCFRQGHWSVPEEIISQKSLVTGLVKVAEIFSQTREIAAEEIDLWIQFLKPVWYLWDDERNKGLIEWDREMRRRRLIAGQGTTAEEFITVGVQLKAKQTLRFQGERPLSKI